VARVTRVAVQAAREYKPGDAFDPDRFVDPRGFKAAVEQLEKTYRDQLARERAPK
jgi:hypothetical protein